ncbi:S8 family serine peptidase [Lactiplantibacillus plantarum]|uniref:S8 family serine peptidase n=1 Tax=Lactiplantibacillus plantarum TaxID=1590 RepID=UPI000FCA3E7B|nr:S8 family serine peptidase [Lactiplantibacillus plantarum]QJS44435.1 S8 family serine peptidase [Lactiplantibacillus plantarum]
MSDEKKHFRIPDKEVNIEASKRRRVPKPKEGFDSSAHAATLSLGIKKIVETAPSSDFSLPKTETIFKVKLDNGQEIERRGNYEDVFLNNNLKVQALIGDSEAVVSSSKSDLIQLEKTVRNYDSSKKSRQIWDYVESITAFTPEEKINKHTFNDSLLKEILDLNVIIAPIWNSDSSNDKMNLAKGLTDQIHQKYPEQPPIEIVALNDNTVSAHIFLPSSALTEFASENFVLSIETTEYFDGESIKTNQNSPLYNAKIDSAIDIEALPTVAIIDDGIKLPGQLAALVKHVYTGATIDMTNPDFGNHGTKVASRCIFGENLTSQSKKNEFVPKVQVIDVPIVDKKLSAQALAERFIQIVSDLHEECSTFLYAYNTQQRFTSENISVLGSVIDSLIHEYGINFIVSTGNHKLNRKYTSLDDIVENNDAKISAPADGLLLTSVGSINSQNKLSSFSRVGSGFNDSMKPGLVYHGGDLPLGQKEAIGKTELVEVIDNSGNLAHDAGTSFSSPLAAADVAIVQQYCLDSLVHPIQGVDSKKIAAFEAKALMYHRGSDAEDIPFNNLRGFGQVQLDQVLHSAKSNATYIRFGQLKRKQRLKIHFLVPKIIESIQRRGHSSLRVVVTVVDFPTAKRISGRDYLDGYIDTSFHMRNSKDNMNTVNPAGKVGRKKWYNIHHFVQDFSTFGSGDWELQLEYYSKPNIPDDSKIDYVVLVTLEDITGQDIDIYSKIESTNRFNIQNVITIENEEGTDTNEQ